jgi:hypothetical protein
MRRSPRSISKPASGLLPSIVREGRDVREVLNLGWLIRNWKIVESFDVYPHPPVVKRVLIGDKVVNHTATLQPDVYLVARLRDGRTYETGYSDLGVMKDWLRRSHTLRDVPITYHPKINATRPHQPRS